MSDLQEKAKKEGILKNDAEEVTKMRSEDNFMVWHSLVCVNIALLIPALLIPH